MKRKIISAMLILCMAVIMMPAADAQAITYGEAEALKPYGQTKIEELFPEGEITVKIAETEENNFATNGTSPEDYVRNVYLSLFYNRLTVGPENCPANLNMGDIDVVLDNEGRPVEATCMATITEEKEAWLLANKKIKIKIEYVKPDQIFLNTIDDLDFREIGRMTSFEDMLKVMEKDGISTVKGHTDNMISADMDLTEFFNVERIKELGGELRLTDHNMLMGFDTAINYSVWKDDVMYYTSSYGENSVGGYTQANIFVVGEDYDKEQIITAIREEIDRIFPIKESDSQYSATVLEYDRNSPDIPELDNVNYWAEDYMWICQSSHSLGGPVYYVRVENKNDSSEAGWMFVTVQKTDPELENTVEENLDRYFPGGHYTIRISDPEKTGTLKIDPSQMMEAVRMMIPNEAVRTEVEHTAEVVADLFYRYSNVKYDQRGYITGLNAEVSMKALDPAKILRTVGNITIDIEYVDPDKEYLDTLEETVAGYDLLRDSSLEDVLDYVHDEEYYQGSLMTYDGNDLFDDFDDKMAAVRLQGGEFITVYDPYYDYYKYPVKKGCCKDDTLYAILELESRGVNFLEIPDGINETEEYIAGTVREAWPFEAGQDDCTVSVEWYDRNKDNDIMIDSHFYSYSRMMMKCGYGKYLDSVYVVSIDKNSGDSGTENFFVTAVTEGGPSEPEMPVSDPVQNIFGDDASRRIAGDDRYETAMAAADSLKKAKGIEKFDNIIVACGDSFADALAGSYLAKVKDAPILVVGKYTEQVIKEYIDENINESGTVYILGGNGAVSDRFEKSLSRYDVKRLGGSDRYATNLSILKEAGVENEDMLICSAMDFADSLSASAVGKPVLLVDKALKPAQENYLREIGDRQYYLIGGVGAVTAEVEKEVSEYGNTVRVEGQNRYETSVEVAKKFFGTDIESITVAYGQDFPDGLTGGPVAMSLSAPLILINEHNLIKARDYISDLNVERIASIGGPALISEKDIEFLLN